MSEAPARMTPRAPGDARGGPAWSAGRAVRPPSRLKEETPLPGRRLAVLSAAAVAAVAAAGTAIAQPATINWTHSFDSSAPENNPTINTGESVTWNVTQGGHNVDVMGPENFKSTNGTDSSGTQFSHTFTKAGKYTYICDYHS